ncbi:hypothetical protein [Halalkalibacter urbisdiaboli]|uniref:hypothetical protein n=1 Tax=Halalkalibacter urbisdiaboli TaxID=1960589 RepID=UPI000B42D2BC|nr:hypothetical protein [Halalkalibacter urbisdiaboli]
MKLKVTLIAGLFIIIIISSLLGLRWYDLNNLSETSEIARSFLNDEGFFILYHSGDFGPYVLAEKELNEKPYSSYLRVQHISKEYFLEKELRHEFFYVSNQFFGVGMTHVTVIMNGEDIVGAFSIKNGMTYPLHGE